MSESSVVSPQRIWLFYDREGEFVTHDRFATSVEAQAFARERNLLPWMPPVSAVGWEEFHTNDRSSQPPDSEAA